MYKYFVDFNYMFEACHNSMHKGIFNSFGVPLQSSVFPGANMKYCCYSNPKPKANAIPEINSNSYHFRINKSLSKYSELIGSRISEAPAVCVAHKNEFQT